jgi:RND family efflux transporter MFP subunit
MSKEQKLTTHNSINVILFVKNLVILFEINLTTFDEIEGIMKMPYKLLLLTFLPIILLLIACSKEDLPEKQTARPIRTMTVGDVSVLRQRGFPGRASATQEVDLAFRVTGPLITRPVNVGDEVKQSAILARIDPRDFEVRLRNAEGNLQRALANSERAQSDYERNLNIQRQDPGAISQAAIDQSKEALDLAKADIAALEASVDAAKDELSYTYLQAPFDGTIVATYVENFEFVQARQRIVRLLDTTRIEFVINIPETMISLTPYVHDIQVVFDAFPGVNIPAEIKEIGTEASEATRTFPVTLIMDQPENVKILPGMAGRASGEVRQPSEAERPDIVIPVTAVFSPKAGSDSYVWVIDESTNTVSRRAIRVGNLTSTGLVIEEGIAYGETIATAGVHFLDEGQQVRPMTQ